MSIEILLRLLILEVIFWGFFQNKMTHTYFTKRDKIVYGKFDHMRSTYHVFCKTRLIHSKYQSKKSP